MPTSVLPDDDEQIIADLLKEMRRLRSRLATTAVKGTHDEFTAAATPATTYTLTYIPLTGTCLMALNGHVQREGTDYTCDYTTGIVTVSATQASSDKITFRYLVTDWLIARSLPPTIDQIVDNFDGTDNAALTTTSDGKATWTIVRGPWEHLTNQAHATSVTGGTAGNVASIDCGNADGTLQATLATTQVSIAFRIVDNANFYAAFSNALYKVVGGTFTSILAYGSVSAPATITVVLAGSLITVFHGATNLGNVTDSTFSTTKHGIHSQRALSTDLINDWSWTSP